MDYTLFCNPIQVHVRSTGGNFPLLTPRKRRGDPRSNYLEKLQSDKLSSSCHVQTFVGISSLLIRHHFWQGEYDHHHIMGLSLPSWLKPTFGRDTSLILTTCEYSRLGLCQEDDLRNVIVHRRHPQYPFSKVFDCTLICGQVPPGAHSIPQRCPPDYQIHIILHNQNNLRWGLDHICIDVHITLCLMLLHILLETTVGGMQSLEQINNK